MRIRDLLRRREPTVKRAARVVAFPDATEPLTWSCHVCGDVRPDARIDVFTRESHLGQDVWARENIRYCNDRSSCIDGAPYISFMSGPPKGEPWLGRK